MEAAATCTRIASGVVQIFWGAGYGRETGISRPYRASKLLEIGTGTAEIRKVIIAVEPLRSPSSDFKPDGIIWRLGNHGKTRF